MKQQNTYTPLYNGNIARMVTAVLDKDEAWENVHGNKYQYDQLNRIRSSNVFDHVSIRSSNSFSGIIDYDY